jgi:hypothetical protein
MDGLVDEGCVVPELQVAAGGGQACMGTSHACSMAGGWGNVGVPASGDLCMGGEPATDEPAERRWRTSLLYRFVSPHSGPPLSLCTLSSEPPSPPLPMPAPSGHLSHDGFVPSSPSTDAHLMDPYAAHQRRYDTESDNAEYGRRDTYASDSSNAHIMEPGYDERNPPYDYYRKYSPSFFVSVPGACLIVRSSSRH